MDNSKHQLLLIRQLQEGDQKALSALYDRYAGAIYGVIIRICKDEQLADELLQETFLKIWNKASLFDPDKGKFYTWAYRIARNTCLNALRNSSKLIQNEDLSVYKDVSSCDSEPDNLALNGAVKQLEGHHQKAIELVYFNGLTHKEAHEEMNVPLGTFKSYIRQALKRLRETYQKELLILWILIEIVC